MSDLLCSLPEGAVCPTSHGPLFTCEVRLRDIYRGAAKLTGAYLSALHAARRVEAGRLGRHLEPLAEADPENTVLIDTETCGFHGRPLFLVGMARCHNGDFVLRQFFARNYSEEAALLAKLAEQVATVGLLVSFNGKAFDWPFVRDRMIYHRLPCPELRGHVDLLHPSRRRWRKMLPDCRLQTLERYLSGRWRAGDVAAAEIPQRYHEFVRRQEARLIAPIFHHNRMDLITLIELLVALLSRPAAEAG